MKSKLLSLMIAGIFVMLLAVSFASAAITLSNPTLSQTGNSVNVTVSSDQNETITFSGLDDITSGGDVITFDTPLPISIEAGISEIIAIDYNVGTFDFEFNEQYSTILEATGSVNPLASQTLSFEVNEEACEVADNGNLDIRVRELNVEEGFGDDNEWFPLDEVSVEVEVENNGGDDIKDIEVEWGLYNKDTGKWIVDDKENDFNLKDGKDETVIINFVLDEDVDEFSDSDQYILYVWATGEDTDNDDELTCASDTENVEIVMESDFVILSDIEAPEVVSCGADVHITADVWNVGEDDQDDVYVYVYNKELGLAEEVEIGDIDALEDDGFVFDFTMPEDAEEKTYGIQLSVYDEDNDLYENDYDDEKSEFTAIVKVEGSCVGSVTDSAATVSASLLSGGQAGKELVVKATITNTGDSLATYSLNAAGYAGWASSATFDSSIIALSEGSSQDVLITFDVNRGVSGDQFFDLEVASENQIVTTQPVAVTITSSGLGLGGTWPAWLWVVVILDVILVIIIIIVAIRVATR